MQLYYCSSFKEAAQYLELAEIFFRPTHPDLKLRKHHWYETLKHLIEAAWNAKLYLKAIQAEINWRKIEPTSNQVYVKSDF